ncbi:acyltransferase family protein [Ketobacter sp.]|uniref:acyltransferase family protein n=1 Tax=Ketobacter sp. TaxID=2083498 RepID=UPI000F1FBF59|nr:acyltransferase [Ketobacter sp.]RLT93068.1 MAG: acyltransferase [Ketobacter sp.]
MEKASSFKRNVASAFKRPNNNIAHIDGLRALSCIGILLYHSFFLLHMFVPEAAFTQFVYDTPLYLSWIWGLDKTVDVFFVISGFLIGRMLFKEQLQTGRINLKAFYWRRYLRLTPVYLFAIVVFFLLAGPKFSQTLWANALYINNFLPLERMSMPWTWTLAVEEQFYILLPFLLTMLILPSRHRLVWLCGLFITSFVIITAIAMGDPVFWHQPYLSIFSGKDNIFHYFDTLYVNLHTRFGTLISGVILAYLSVHHQPLLQRITQHRPLAAGLTLVFILIAVAGILVNGNKHWLGDSVIAARLMLILDRNLFGIAVCWVILMCSAPGWLGYALQRILGARIWYPFAQLSYSMYLFHYMLAMILMWQWTRWMKLEYGADLVYQHHWFLLVFLALLALTMPFSLLAFALVEKPFMDRRAPAIAVAGVGEGAPTGAQGGAELAAVSRS